MRRLASGLTGLYMAACSCVQSQPPVQGTSLAPEPAAPRSAAVLDVPPSLARMPEPIMCEASELAHARAQGRLLSDGERLPTLLAVPADLPPPPPVLYVGLSAPTTDEPDDSQALALEPLDAASLDPAAAS